MFFIYLNIHVYLLLQSCVWKLTSDGSPNCIYPAGYGYRMDGAKQDTPHGFLINLKRIDHPAMFPESADVTELTFEVEYHSAHQLRVKV